MNNNIYITVLDFLQGETFEYEYINGKDFFDESYDINHLVLTHRYDIESFLEGKGHLIKNISYMTHTTPITKVQIDGLRYSDYV